jgi:hypothetical protein
MPLSQWSCSCLSPFATACCRVHWQESGPGRWSWDAMTRPQPTRRRALGQKNGENSSCELLKRPGGSAGSCRKIEVVEQLKVELKAEKTVWKFGCIVFYV